MPDRELLTRLRRVLERARAAPGLPMEALLDLTGLKNETGITIDFDAAEELGHPLVVLRPREIFFSELSRRERDVAALVAQGLSNKEIAERLFISLATVKDHVHHILEKTGLRSRTALAAAART